MDTSRLRFPKGLPRIVVKMIKARLTAAEEHRVRVHVHRRDRRRCFFPGCRERTTDLHHVRPKSLGGPFTARNLISACRRHHRWITSGLLRVTGNPERAPVQVFVTPIGYAARIRVPQRGVA